MIVETDRLALRPLAAADLDHLVHLDADAAVRRYVDEPEAPSRRDVVNRFPRLLARYADGAEPAFRAAEEKPKGTFVGWFHLRPLDGDEKTLDLGYRLRRDAWGRGYATEGARALVHRAFTVLGAERVVAHVLEANAGSRRVLEKVGLHLRTHYRHRGVLPACSYELDRRAFLGEEAP